MTDYDPIDAPEASSLPANPYHADYGDDDGLITAPFAGRKAALGRLYQQLTDPSHSGALVYIGRRHGGKTALLRAFDSAFSSGYAGAYLSLRSTPPENETALMLALAQSATAALIQAGAGLARLQDMEPPGEFPREWFTQSFLPNAIASLRQGRRLVFLIDDAERLLIAMRAGSLRDDIFTFLRDLMTQFPGLAIVMTINAEYEDELSAFSPLVQPINTVRLGVLEADETRWLLQEPARGWFTVPDDCADSVHRATGGQPGLAQHFGYQIFRRWLSTPDVNVITLDDVRALTPKVYQYAEPDFRYLWTRLSAGERAVLSAISQLNYDDPLRAPDAAAIEAWLVETDFPLDAMAIGAILRGLEYKETIVHAGGGVRPSAGLWATWLLENGQFDSRSASLAQLPELPPVRTELLVKDTAAAQPQVPVRGLLIVGTILGVIVAIIVLLALNSSGGLVVGVPQPTVTLNVTP
ncbi:hypothetical protein FBR02_04555 [Anaerolineae bacterium CFX9]|nr:hypothetical protein [Anaerolineae bacterium CFX9]